MAPVEELTRVFGVRPWLAVVIARFPCRRETTETSSTPTPSTWRVAAAIVPLT
jgi:hypothetical protein